MLDRIRMCLLVAVLCSCLVFSVQGVTVKMVRSVSFDNRLDERYVVTDLTGLPHMGACASFCHKDVRCVAIAYNILTGRCLLHSVHFYNMNMGVSQEGWRYFKLFTDKCPKNYVYNRVAKLCFRHYRRADYWTKCVQRCNERNSSLLIIDTAEKQAELVRQSMCTKVYSNKTTGLEVTRTTGHGAGLTEGR
ncbi:uncharacterized protein LOC124252975 [Haliotis rubra]|uniref:uncharacterized protein LOC124252975 n=1 Tax=Haliotis rubra TaxID=36100 RepID=UPI001EE6133E|nr:uncharacterized protein LOC124252975 [Haliotis rubra]